MICIMCLDPSLSPSAVTLLAKSSDEQIGEQSSRWLSPPPPLPSPGQFLFTSHGGSAVCEYLSPVRDLVIRDLYRRYTLASSDPPRITVTRSRVEVDEKQVRRTDIGSNYRLGFSVNQPRATCLVFFAPRERARIISSLIGSRISIR